MYICEDCGRKWTDSDAAENDFLCTRKCNGGLAPVPEAPAGELIHRLPFPVAYPWHMSLKEDLDPIMRVNNMIFTAYQAMRLTGLLLLSDYLASDGNCIGLGRPLAKMRMPHWGEWKGLTDSLAKYMAGRNTKYAPPSVSVFGRLAVNWSDMGKAWKADGRREEFARQNKNAPPMVLFQELRNDRAHRQGVQSGVGDEPEILARYLPVLDFVLSSLFAGCEPDLFRLPVAETAEAEAIRDSMADESAETIPLIHLVGVHADFRFDIEETPLEDDLRDALRDSSVAARLGDRTLPVYPFFLALDLEGMGSGGLIEPVTLVDAFSEKKVAHLGVTSHGVVEGLGPKVVELLAAKNHELGLSRDEADRWLMVEWARDNAMATLQNMTMKKYFPQCYIDRPGDKSIALSVRGPDKGAVVAGEAGSGKSSLLCRFVEELARASGRDEDPEVRQRQYDKKVRGKEMAEPSSLEAFMSLRGAGDVVIFLSGRQGVPAEADESMERALCRSLLRSCGVKESAFDTPMEFIRRLDENVTAPASSPKKDGDEGRKVWIILDAVNEVDRFRDFAKALDRFMRETARYPWLRVICSMRTGSLAALQEGDRRGNIHGSLPFTDEAVYHVFTNLYPTGEKQEPWMHLPAFTPGETRSAYEHRQSNLPERAALNPYDSLGPDLRALLANPLFLHVFHETWKGERADISAVYGEDALFEAYLNSLARELPGIGDTLRAIGDYLYDHETPFWPDDEAWRLTDRWIRENHFDSVMQVCALTPVETLVSASLLMRPTDDRRGYQFSHQKICEQVLKRKLEEIWAERGRQGYSDGDGLEDVRDIFQTWLEKGERFDWLANAAATLLGEWVYTAESRFLPLLPGVEGDVETALEAVCRSIFLEMCDLEQLGQEAVDFIRSGFSVESQYDPFFQAMFDSHQIATTTGKTKGIFHILDASIPFHEALVAQEPHRTDFRRDLSVSFSNVGSIYETLGQGGKALEFYEKSLKVMEELVAQEPHRTDFRRDLSVSFNNVGNIYETLGQGGQSPRVL